MLAHQLFYLKKNIMKKTLLTAAFATTGLVIYLLLRKKYYDPEKKLRGKI